MKTKVLDRNIQGKCKLCDKEFVHDWSSHFFETMNELEAARYSAQVIKHFKEEHHECPLPTPIFEIYARRIVKGILKDALGLIILPFGFVVSVFYKAFEWLNNKIGLFD